MVAIPNATLTQTLAQSQPNRNQPPNQTPTKTNPPMLLLIDNYDSFTYNLVHYLGELGAEVAIKRNDAITADEAIALNPTAIVLSPGPCDPDKAGICLSLVTKAHHANIPLLGVCLGHQSIAQAFGGTITRATDIVHGKMGVIHHDGKGIFAKRADPV